MYILLFCFLFVVSFLLWCPVLFEFILRNCIVLKGGNKNRLESFHILFSQPINLMAY